jgi:SHS2 domain-containing protein
MITLLYVTESICKFVHRFGESYDLSKHPQGTEIKAITYSNMQIFEDKVKTELFVIVDI